MALTLHPDCGKRFPSGSTAGHCGLCCETFIGLAAFEAHRVGAHGTPERRCELQFGKNGHWQDDRGYWHHGPRMTAERREELFG